MKLLKGLWIGFWSGLILGLLLKWIQSVTGEQVYTLLLNVDFIPLIGDVPWSEITEFIFHMSISLIIGVVFVYLAKRRNYSFGQLVIISLLLAIPFPFLYFLLSWLASKLMCRLPLIGEHSFIGFSRISHMLCCCRSSIKLLNAKTLYLNEIQRFRVFRAIGGFYKESV